MNLISPSSIVEESLVRIGTGFLFLIFFVNGLLIGGAIATFITKNLLEESFQESQALHEEELEAYHYYGMKEAMLFYSEAIADLPVDAKLILESRKHNWIENYKEQIQERKEH